MHSDVRDSDPFTAIWVGGSLADGCSSQQQGIDTQLWLYCIAEALKTYRTRQVILKNHYQLTVDKAEYTALNDGLAGC